MVSSKLDEIEARTKYTCYQKVGIAMSDTAWLIALARRYEAALRRFAEYEHDADVQNMALAALAPQDDEAKPAEPVGE